LKLLTFFHSGKFKINIFALHVCNTTSEYDQKINLNIRNAIYLNEDKKLQVL